MFAPAAVRRANAARPGGEDTHRETTGLLGTAPPGATARDTPYIADAQQDAGHVGRGTGPTLGGGQVLGVQPAGVREGRVDVAKAAVHIDLIQDEPARCQLPPLASAMRTADEPCAAVSAAVLAASSSSADRREPAVT